MHTREEKKGKGVLALTSVIKGEHLTQLWLRIPCLIQNQHKCPSPALKLLYQERGVGNRRIFTKRDQGYQFLMIRQRHGSYLSRYVMGWLTVSEFSR